MKSLHRVGIASLCAVLGAASLTRAAPYVPKETGHKAHDKTVPLPPAVEAAAQPVLEQAPKAPSDAIVLFDGKDASAWQTKGGPAAFKVQDGMLVADKADITTREKFGDVQLHLEWQVPADDRGEGQDNGNSGVKLMGQYEVQVIHSHKDENKTYADGIAGAIYGQYPPLVNVARPRGQWQTYDIVWTAPRRDALGEVVTPAYVTVMLNGVLVQDHAEILGNTSGPARGYKKHGDQEPLLLQWHGHPIRYRNIWVRRLDAPKGEAK
jgi:hypothetical protein